MVLWESAASGSGGGEAGFVTGVALLSDMLEPYVGGGAGLTRK